MVKGSYKGCGCGLPVAMLVKPMEGAVGALERQGRRRCIIVTCTSRLKVESTHSQETKRTVCHEL